ncbi:hypothetical protein Poly30_39750 [Planctomycetes bacterium Poly30]|uniref:Uncharacterized protein n=1 Tax=Saltatorellus ferox TaxID=2528018 RepID=A0A518EWG8_9BACT|nr:hypothetical protein Poly30_39750 [Planctomycetes bacterium Poly30]
MRRSTWLCLSWLFPGLLSTLGHAQELLACRHSPARIELYDAMDGSLINGTYVDIDGLLGLGGATSNIWDVQRAPNGELLVSSYSAQAIQRFSADGSMYLGDLPTSAGASTGIDINGNVLGIAASTAPGGVYRFDSATMTQTQVSTTTGNWDVTSLGSQWLVARTNGTVVSIDPLTGTETPWGNPGGFCEQIVVQPSGEILVANYGSQGYSVHDSTGAILQTYFSLGAGSIRGIAPLGNGNVMLSGVSGLSIYDPVANTVVTVDTGAGAFLFGGAGNGGLGTSYCMANANSTGATGRLSAAGSPLVSSNDLMLEASDLPPLSFGFFIVSRMQSFIQNPAGSAGNLCLTGSIGRYVGPGQIQQSNLQGAFSLGIDLTNIPQPLGFVAVQPGESWSFQVWHRDTAGGQPTSNFSQGLEIAFQ